MEDSVIILVVPVQVSVEEGLDNLGNLVDESKEVEVVTDLEEVITVDDKTHSQVDLVEVHQGKDQADLEVLLEDPGDSEEEVQALGDSVVVQLLVDSEEEEVQVLGDSEEEVVQVLGDSEVALVATVLHLAATTALMAITMVVEAPLVQALAVGLVLR